MHEITVYEDGTINTTDAAILCGIQPVSLRQRVRRGLLREVRREKGRILVYLMDVARLDRAMQGQVPRVSAEVSWRLDGEPDVDILSVFRACDEIARQVTEPVIRESVVYYVRFADRIKIGTTICLTSRLDDLPYDEMLATEPGGAEVEHERHIQFAEHWITGEWFRVAPEIMEHVEKLRAPSFACVTPDV
jgi:hypothetical protein